MSEAIQRRAVELLWKQWTAVGVAGVAPMPERAVDLEALIAFTPYAAWSDPRLEEESVDWCARIGRPFVSISRLRQIVRMMPPRSGGDAAPLASMLIDKFDVGDRRLSGKSRAPHLEHSSLIQLRSRRVFGVGARADIIARLVARESSTGPQRLSAIRPIGYTKQAVATVLDDLVHAAVLEKLVRGTAISYQLVKDAPLRSLLAPLPKRMTSWTERFVIVANVLETWRRFGARRSFAIELSKVLDSLRPFAAATGVDPPTAGRPDRLLREIDRWATALLEDDVWEDSWTFDGDDVTTEILDTLSDDVVEAVQSGDYPAGYTELEQMMFRHVDRKAGTAGFHVRFAAEHPREDFAFGGHVAGTFRFDPDAKDKQEFLESVAASGARAHFDMGDPDEP